MTDDNLVPVLAYVLEDNATINLAANGFITIGTPGKTAQDAKLEGANQTAIWLRRISKTENAFFNSSTTGEYQYDQLIQVDVLSKLSQSTAYNLADDVESLIKSTTSKVYGTNTYRLPLLLQGRTAFFEPTLEAWVESITFRAVGTYTAT